ncbi:DedA family protein [Rhodobacterales bacterium LSUCC0031]|nr:DedA family protein [Rhodobacterales bacterium LSUCC0031]
MTEAILALVPVYGLALLTLSTFFSCLALPVPSSLIMLAAGGFAAAGDLVLWKVWATSLIGAITGDQMGYIIGRHAARYLKEGTLAPRHAALLARAEAKLHQNAAAAVFFSRWLVSPLGPYVNFAGGAAGVDWRGFTRAGAAGEMIWVTLYVGLGAAFADDIVALAAMLGNASGLLAALAVMGALGLWLRAALRQRGHG